MTAIKKSNGKIQETSQCRRAGPNQQGRPTNEQRLKIQLVVSDEDDFVAHSIPKKPRKKKIPYSLAAAVDSKRPGEKKY